MNIDNLLKWSPRRKVFTKQGPRYLRSGQATPEFWEAWNAEKQALKEWGISVRKDAFGKWEVSEWRPLPKSEVDSINTAIAESKATDYKGHIPVPEGLEYLPFQRAGIIYASNHTDTLIADDMGCLSGESIIQISRGGKDSEYTLKELYEFFNGISGSWDRAVPTKTRSLCDGEIRLREIKQVLYKGNKQVFRLTLQSGKEITATADHEIAVSETEFRQLEKLMPGDTVLSDSSVNFLTKKDEVISVVPAGGEEVYDIVMEDPYRNFAANGVIVHNCGKTVQAIGLINLKPEIKFVLVISPATLKLNWEKELNKWLVKKRTIGVIGPKTKEFPKTDIIIINYEQIRKYKKEIQKRVWDLMVADEIHYCKNSGTIRTQYIFGRRANKRKDHEAIPPIQAKRKVFLTGTPIVNKPEELWTLVHVLDPKDLGKNKWVYLKRYCGAFNNGFGLQTGGATNLEELQMRLRGKFMIRRLKSEVLKELPPKRRQIIEFEADDRVIKQENESAKAHEEVLERLRANVELSRASDNAAEYKKAVEALQQATVVAFSQMADVRHRTALAKLDYVYEHLENALEAGPVIVFCHHKDVVEAINKRFPKSVILTGDSKIEDRQKAVDDFQNGKVDLFIGTIRAAGVGLTLTRASHVIFVELDWTPAAVTQSEDRCCRIGQKSSVLVQHLVLAGSLDAHIAKTLVAKQDVIDRALDKDVLLSTEPVVPLRADPPPTIVNEPLPILSSEEITQIHLKLKQLAAMCDGARGIDGQGFSKCDAYIGKSLAQATFLSQKQAHLGRKLVNRYRAQL